MHVLSWPYIVGMAHDGWRICICIYHLKDSEEDSHVHGIKLLATTQLKRPNVLFWKIQLIAS